jgi:hypothetical protein
MACKSLFLALAVLTAFTSCTAERPVENKKTGPASIVKPKHLLLSQEERRELGFPPQTIARVELAAGAEAEPFFRTVVLRTENLKGEKKFEGRELAGFSVHTTKADEVIESLRSPLRAQGYLIFKSHKGYGALPDIITVVKGNNSYDILKMQETEGGNYRIQTKTIIAWLKARQKEGTFVVTGAGSDWVEARFIKQPKNMKAFAKKVIAFAPDVRVHGPKTPEKLAERMRKMNGFHLLWD